MNSRLTSLLTAVALTACAGLAIAADSRKGPPVPPIADTDVQREGSAGDSRRDKLTGMEMKSSTVDWSLLSDWQGGNAPAADSLKDKVVLLAFWSGWQPSNQTLIARVAQIAEREKDKGLVVIAAHNDTRFDSAAKVLADRGIKVLNARDGGNKLRAALSSDGDPDLYLVDRAGNLRYADIASDSLEKAVTRLLGETPAQASEAPVKFAQALKDKATRQSLTRQVGTGIDAGKKLKVTFAPPEPAAFDKAFWPAQNDKDLVSQLGTDYQGQAAPFNFEAVQWLNTAERKSPELLGKVVIVDFWATWCGPCKRAMPLLDEMQRTFRDDLQIVGVSGFKFGNSSSDQEEKYPQGEPRPVIEQYLREHNSEYAHAYDTGSTIAKKVKFNAIPMMLVLSSDGVVRWQGNPHQPNFRKIVEQVINVDPGVKARRDAERAAIASQGG